MAAKAVLTKIKEDLVAGRGKIERGWCQGEYAKDMFNLKTAPDSLDAMSYCALGAIRDTVERYPTARAYLVQALPPESPRVLGVSHYNDDPERTKVDILALYDRAIALVEMGIQGEMK